VTSQNLKEGIPQLDGLRGMAIIMVLFYHCQFNTEIPLMELSPIFGPIITKILLSGFIGVDLFFVLSGFLITRILISTKDSPQYLLKFYGRRFLRIFPLYYGVLILIFFIFPYFISFDQPTKEIVSKQWWLWTYLVNVPLSGGWNSGMFYFSHFWSLAVEEHFYLLWPAVVFMFDFKWLKRICLGVAIASSVIGVISAMFGDRLIWLFHWTTVNHVGGLALGSLFALIQGEKGTLDYNITWAKRGFLLFGILLFALVFIPRHFHPGLSSQFLTIGSSVFFISLLHRVVTMPHSLLGRFFSLRMLRSFGKISYGLYVYHFILIPQIDIVLPINKLITWSGSFFVGIIVHSTLVIGGTFLLAYISWHVYEKQFLKLKKYFAYETKDAGTGIPASAGASNR
jgi:peptidoglycan/LPS O-acetylase OafA/YrhL